MSSVKCTCPECGLVFDANPYEICIRVRGTWTDENGQFQIDASPPGARCPDCGAHAVAVRRSGGAVET